MTKPKLPKSLDEIRPLPALIGPPGRLFRHPHGVASVTYAKPASAQCACGLRLSAPSDDELTLLFGTHVREERVRRGLKRDGSRQMVHNRPAWSDHERPGEAIQAKATR